MPHAHGRKGHGRGLTDFWIGLPMLEMELVSSEQSLYIEHFLKEIDIYRWRWQICLQAHFVESARMAVHYADIYDFINITRIPYNLRHWKLKRILSILDFSTSGACSLTDFISDVLCSSQYVTRLFTWKSPFHGEFDWVMHWKDKF